MARALFIHKYGSLVPMDADGRALMQRVRKRGEPVWANITIARNWKLHRLFFATISKIEQSGAWNGDKETLRRYLLIATGYTDWYIDPETGKLVMIPRSMADENMGGDEFEDFFNKAMIVLFERVLAGADKHVLRDEIAEMVRY
jgi:hypothetical protein